MRLFSFTQQRSRRLRCAFYAESKRILSNTKIKAVSSSKKFYRTSVRVNWWLIWREVSPEN